MHSNQYVVVGPWIEFSFSGRSFLIRGKFPEDKVMAFLENLDFDGENGCWLWLGGARRGTHGVFTFKSKQVSAYRFAFELLSGDIPSGHDIHHRIESPIKCLGGLCCNPEHLVPVTPDEHLRLHGKTSSAKSQGYNRLRLLGLCRRGHKMVAYEYPDGHVTKRCRTCRAEYRKQKLAKHREANPLPPPPTHCRHGHELIDENLYIHPKFGKVCRICRDDRLRAWRAAHPKQGRGHQRTWTHCVNGHEFTTENTYIFNGERNCRACRNEAAKRQYYKKLAVRTHCKRGHPWIEENLNTLADGTKRCRLCRMKEVP